MADDSKLVKGLKDGLEVGKQLNKEFEGVANNAERTANAVSGMKTGGNAANFQGGNQRSSGAPSASSYPGMGSPGGYGGMGDPNNSYPGMNNVPTPNFRSGASLEAIKGLLGAGLQSAVSALPSPNEALYTALMGERLRFYGARGPGGGSLTGLYGPNGAFNLQQSFSTMGTPTSALDAVYAANSGAGMGLLPGLRNFSRGLEGYGGILGGAALASNLNPGLGLVGGMGVMGAMNQARRVNMLKMIGVSVRDIGSAEMNNLPEIIAKLYRILRNAKGGEITPRDIAVSAQSGNALDSLLNQYFDDPNLRQTVISGLMQMAQTGGQNLAFSGRVGELMKTGGSTIAVGSLGQTDTQELRMIQAFTNATTKGTVRANQVLQQLYGGLQTAAAMGSVNDKSGMFGLLGDQPSNLASLLAMGETISGARGGAGQILVAQLIKSAGQLGPVGMALGLGTAGLFGADYFAGTLGPDLGGIATPSTSYGYLRKPTAGNIFNVNVGSPNDPGSIADSVSRAITNSLNFTARTF